MLVLRFSEWNPVEQSASTEMAVAYPLHSRSAPGSHADLRVDAVVSRIFVAGMRRRPPHRKTAMPELTTPRELFLHELGDILYVERKLSDEVLPKLIGEVSDEEFKSGLESHLEETRQHVANVEKVFELVGEEPEVEMCVGFEGLKSEHDQLIEESASSLVDIIDVGAAARTENYEIAAYEGLRRMAKAMGKEEAVDLLDANLKQEKEALREVEKIATRLSNESAKETSAA
jgi:ferritin-like metal-binding protein YciE